MPGSVTFVIPTRHLTRSCGVRVPFLALDEFAGTQNWGRDERAQLSGDINLSAWKRFLRLRGSYESGKITGLTLHFLAIPALSSMLLIPGITLGQNQNPTSTATSPDNSTVNKAQAATADQASEASSDRMLTQKIRKSIVADKSLSTYGHNVKIITKDGAVTLKGPVHSEEEKQNIGAKAADAAGGADKITNQLTVKP
jgi:hyperosmotically inducible periplasmic protein